MEQVETPRERLGRVVAARRRALGLSASQAARDAGVSRSTWISIENGTRDTEKYVYAKVERALSWATGSFDRVLDGNDPIEGPGVAPVPVVVTDPDLKLYVQMMDDPDVDPRLKRIMRDQFQVWYQQSELQKETRRRKSA
jgi:transcriptional regulator with XRE-family HTH domain